VASDVVASLPLFLLFLGEQLQDLLLLGRARPNQPAKEEHAEQDHQRDREASQAV
jgi:hypothetical protein